MSKEKEFKTVEQIVEDVLECNYCGRNVKDYDDMIEVDVCESCQESLNDSPNEELYRALAENFECGISSIVDIDETTYQINGIEYLVYTEDEADEKVKDYIEESLWTFHPTYLANYCDLPIEVFEILVKQCEESNDAISSLVDKFGDIDEFVEKAVHVHSRGHFLNRVDGSEDNVCAEDGEIYYIYKRD